MFARTFRRFRQLLSAGRIPARPRKPLRRQLDLEGLEERTLLSCNVHHLWVPFQWQTTVICDAAPDTVTMTVVNNNRLLLTVNGDTHGFWLSEVDDILIKGGAGNDTINVERTPAGETTTLRLDEGSDTVNISPAARNLGNIDGALSINDAYSDPTTIRFNDQAHAGNSTYKLEWLLPSIAGRLGRPGVAQMDYAINANSANSVTINGGSGSTTFNVPTMMPYVPTVLNTGTGVNTVNVGITHAPLTINGQNGADVVNLGTAGSAQGIINPVHITNAGSYTTVNIDNGADTVNQTSTLTATSLTGLAPAQISWGQADVRALNVNSSGFSHTFTITGTPTNGVFQGVTLNTSGYDDRVNVRATNSALRINSGGGSDAIFVGSTTNTLNAIQGPVTVSAVGSGDGDMLSLLDTGNNAGQVFVVTANSVSRSGMADISFSFIESLSVQAGLGDDHAVVVSKAANTGVALHGGGGANYLYGPEAATVWTISGSSNGSYTSNGMPGAVFFYTFGNLIGGGGNDQFRFANGASLTGFVLGGGGTNKLDYGLYQSNVYVNLVAYEATGMSFPYEIQDIVGGAGNDILVGDDQSNSLEGGLGRDILIGGGVSYTLNADVLLGGAGQDILIAGWTYYDWDTASLQFFRDTWTGPATYAQRVASLSAYFNAATVFSNQASNPNVVQGGADLDWFFARATDLDDSAGETFVEIF